MNDKFYFIEDILPESVKKIVQIAKYEKQIIDFTKTILSETMKNHCKPIYIKSNILIIAVDNPLWANEIINYKQHFIGLINKRFDNYIKDIKTKFLPNYFVTKKENKKLSEEDKAFIEEKLEKITDTELKEKLEKLLESFIIVDKK